MLLRRVLILLWQDKWPKCLSGAKRNPSARWSDNLMTQQAVTRKRVGYQPNYRPRLTQKQNLHGLSLVNPWSSNHSICLSSCWSLRPSREHNYLRSSTLNTERGSTAVTYETDVPEDSLDVRWTTGYDQLPLWPLWMLPPLRIGRGTGSDVRSSATLIFSTY